MQAIIKQSNNTVLNLLKLAPLFGIVLLTVLFSINALSGTGIFLIVLLVSSFCAVLIVIQNYNEEDQTSLVIQFLIMLNVWFITYPIYFFQREEREKKGDFALVASFFTFVLIIGAGELYRFGYLKSVSENLSYAINIALFAVIYIILYSAPIILANIFNSTKKSLAIIFSLTAVGLNLITYVLSFNSFFVVIVGITSLVLYIFSLRMAFFKLSSD